MRHIGIAALAAAVALTGQLSLPAANAEMTEAGKVASAKAGQIMFEHRCRSCHADDPAQKSYGPSLVGVVGRKAGTLDGFSYSDALKASGLIWSEASLKAWMADNTTIMPGTRMRHVGVTEPIEQDFIVAYLKSLTK